MFVQIVGSKQLVYVKDRTLDYMSVADEFGMATNGSLDDHVVKTEEPYVNKMGVSIPSIRLHGRTVDIHVVNDTVTAADSSPGALTRALNSFPEDSSLTISGFTFVSKFSWYETWALTIVDSAQRKFSLREYGRKDLKGIYNLMTHLGDNNGKLYEPVIARYVYTSYQMPKHRSLVGYFDLGEYLAVIRDRRYEELFMTNGRGKTLAFVELKSNVPPSVKITGVVDNRAILSLINISGTYDAKKLSEFKPYVIVTRQPLKINSMRFPWTKVKFDKVDVFMTPIMSLSDAWETLEGGINLLSPAKGNDQNLRF